MITIKIKNGIPERELTGKELELTNGFPVNYFPNRIEHLESGDKPAEYPIGEAKTETEILSEAVDKRLKELGLIPK